MKRLLHAAEDALLEGSVVLAYTRTGYRRRSKRWDPADTDVDMTGKVCVVTGANSGIGLATTEALAARGATVVMGCRNPERGEAARASVAADHPDANLLVEQVDVSSVRDTIDFATRIRDRFGGVDVLVNNAGVMLDTRSESVDGVEMSWATNVLGGWVLTRELLPALEAAAPARVVHVTSGGMYTRRLDLEDPFWERKPWDGVVAYANTKRAQVILNELWGDRLAGTGVTSNAMHPGWAATPGVSRSLPRFERLLKGMLRNRHEGADTLVWLAVNPRLAEVSGELFFDRKVRRTHVLPWTKSGEVDRRALWALCEELASAVARG